MKNSAAKKATKPATKVATNKTVKVAPIAQPTIKPTVAAIDDALQVQINDGFDFVINATTQACTGKSQMNLAIKSVCQVMKSLDQKQIFSQVKEHLNDMVESIIDTSAIAIELNDDLTVDYKLWLKNHANTMSAFRNTFSNNLELISNAPSGKKWTLKQVPSKDNTKVWSGTMELHFTDKKLSGASSTGTGKGKANDDTPDPIDSIIDKIETAPLPTSDIATAFEAMPTEGQRLLLVELAKHLKLSPTEAVKALCGVTVQVVHIKEEKAA